MTITKITLFLLASIVQCKAQGCFDTFTSCLQIGDQFETSTCLPLRATNQSMYSICECYRYVNRDICYNQCPNNATLQQERSTIIAPQINQTCTPAGLNPKGLPQPPPWQSLNCHLQVQPIQLPQAVQGQQEPRLPIRLAQEILQSKVML
ncbi:hypothetical protein BASA60_001546 [Batrachochytrium salamandrivorans]|nr:hypothetical protein BASA60_001546 [Batrachochytrium salamandrivorans]